eukprot:4409277-Amphidinium_carterae.1
MSCASIQKLYIRWATESHDSRHETWIHLQQNCVWFKSQNRKYVTSHFGFKFNSPDQSCSELQYVKTKDAALAVTENDCGWTPLHLAAHGREMKSSTSMKPAKFSSIVRFMYVGVD